jgi:DNA-binding NarL/FixJ family response regulator
VVSGIALKPATCFDATISQMATRVLIVDDHEAFRAWATRTLRDDGLDVVGQAATGNDAILAAREHRPDLILLDIQLPDVSGFEVADRLRGNAAVVVLTSSRDAADYRTRLAGTPAAGFLPKDEVTGEALLAFLHKGRS